MVNSSNQLPKIQEAANLMANQISFRVNTILLAIVTLFFGAFYYIEYTFKTRKIFEVLQGYLNHMLISNDFFEVTRSLKYLLQEKAITGFWIYSLPEHELKTVGSQSGFEPNASIGLDVFNDSFTWLSTHTINIDSGQNFEIVFAHRFSILLPLMSFAAVLMILFYLKRFVLKQSNIFSCNLISPITLLSKNIKETTFESNKVCLTNSELAFSEVKDVQDKFSDLHNHLVDTDKKLQLSAHDSAIARMTTTIAHDLRVPMAVFANIVNVDRWQQFLSLKPQLLSALGRLEAMVVAIRRNEADINIKPDMCVIDFQSLVNEALTYVGGSSKLVDVKTEYIGFMYVDKPRLERAIVNLLVNALEAANKVVRIVVSEKKENILISISDDGPGVDTAFMPQLFVFGKSHSKPGGTGMGLNYVKSVVEKHGGAVEYKRKDKCTFFEISLPTHPLMKNSKPGQEKVFSFSDVTKLNALLVFENEVLGKKYFRKFDTVQNVKLISLKDMNNSNYRSSIVITDSHVVLEKAHEQGTPTYFCNKFSQVDEEINKVLKRVKLAERSMANA